MADWFNIQDIETLDTPAMVVYPERVDQNIRTLISMVGETSRLRPHVKTHKNPEVVHRLLRAGIVKYKCATIAEAEMLAQCGAPDVLLAYQPVGPKINRLIALIQQYPATSFSALTDNIPAAGDINREAELSGVTIKVYADLNVGMNRTGIAPGEDAVLLYKACAKLTNLKPVGLHAYDGHIRDKDFETRKQRCDEKFSEVENVAHTLMKSGFPTPVIIAGGSPSFSIHCNR